MNNDDTTAHNALVLGAGSDIAIATVAELSRHGLTRAALAARHPEAAMTAVATVAEQVELTPLTWDVTEVAGHEAMLDRAVEALGRIDVVIMAVGLLGHHAGLGMSPGDIDVMIRTNFSGPAAALGAVADRLIEQRHGTIVVLTSVAGVRARRSNFVYGSTKAGLDLFAQGLGDALDGHGVRVVVVRPGFVRSKMTTGLDPAPFATTPDVVARHIVDALAHPHRDVVPVPRLLGPLFGVFRSLPRRVWRRIAGDR